MASKSMLLCLILMIVFTFPVHDAKGEIPPCWSKERAEQRYGDLTGTVVAIDAEDEHPSIGGVVRHYTIKLAASGDKTTVVRTWRWEEFPAHYIGRTGQWYIPYVGDRISVLLGGDQWRWSEGFSHGFDPEIQIPNGIAVYPWDGSDPFVAERYYELNAMVSPNPRLSVHVMIGGSLLFLLGMGVTLLKRRQARCVVQATG